jgi:hypothetical protein
MFKPFFSPLLKVLGKILLPAKMSKCLRQMLAWMLIETVILLAIFGAVITGTVVLMKALP